MLTLKKVKEMVKAPAHTKRVPSPKVLLEEGRIFLRKEFEHGSHLTLYHNGYVWFSAGKRNTVFHIRDCRGDYAYDKAVVLRLFESGNISHQQAEKLLEVGSADVMKRASLTGKAKRWQLDGKGTESFGTLLEKVEYNRQHEYLTESREKEDVAYLVQLKKEYGLD